MKETGRAVIFTEANQKIGLGHLSRCCALHDKLLSFKIQPLLVINCDHTVETLLDKKYYIKSEWYGKADYYVKDGDYAIVDSYIAKLSDYETILEVARKALYIDDDERLRYPDGIIVNPSIYGTEMKYAPLTQKRVLTGPEFTILRSAFECRNERIVKSTAKNVLITMGGTDVRNLTPIISEVITAHFPSLKQHIILGNNSADIQQYTKNNCQVYENLSDTEMAKLMRLCDFGVCAYGQTIIEAVKTKLPIIGVLLVDRQEFVPAFYQSLGLAEYAGKWNSGNLSAELIEKIFQILDFKTRYDFVCRQSQIAERINGAENTVKALLKEDVK